MQAGTQEFSNDELDPGHFGFTFEQQEKRRVDRFCNYRFSF